MSVLEKHQKLLLVSIIAIFSIASFFLNLTIEFIILMVLLASLFFQKKYISLRFFIFLLLIVICLPFYTNYRLPKPDYLHKMAPCSVKLKGVITSVSDTKSKNRKKLECETVEICSFNENCRRLFNKTLILTKDNKQNIVPGNFISVEGNIEKPSFATNPSQFDYADYLSTKNIFTILKAEKVSVIKNTYDFKWVILQNINNLRDKVLAVHSKFVTERQLEILGGMVFGANAISVDNDIKKDFTNSGLLHLLAASGMNVAFIFAAIFGFCNLISLRKDISLIIGGISVAVYSIMTGMPPSIVRAAGMLELVVLGKILERDIDNLVLLALICASMLILNPIGICDIGFQLSFLATFGLLFMTADVVNKLKPFPLWLSSVIFVPILAQLWVLPIQVYHFNNIAVYSILANIIVVPISELLSFLGFASSLIALVPYVGVNICFLADKINIYLINLLLFSANKMAHLTNSLIYVQAISIWAVIFYYMILTGFGFLLKNKITLKSFSLICILFLSLILIVSFPNKSKNELKITFFDVGFGDATLIHTPLQKNILIDDGNYSKTGFSAVNTIILPYLRDKGINKIDLLVLTHPDIKHIGGTEDLLSNIKVSMIIDNSEPLVSEKLAYLKKYFSKSNYKFIHINKEPFVFKDGELKITFIKPSLKKSKSVDEKSLITYIEYKKFNSLLLSDNKKKTLEFIKNKFNKQFISVIKAGNHGDKTSLDSEFLNISKPQAVLISVGDNLFRYPQAALLKLLKRQNIQVYRTDKDYCIELISSGNSFNSRNIKKCIPHKTQ